MRDFGPTWPEVKKGMSGSDMTQHKPGLGWLPQQAILRILPQGKILKICKRVYTCPACQFNPELAIKMASNSSGLPLDKNACSSFAPNP